MVSIDSLDYFNKRYEQHGAATPWYGNKYRKDTHEARMEFLRQADYWGSVLDFGCGTGAYCSLFSKDWYKGYDQIEAAVEIAREENPGYDFGTSQSQYGYMTFFANCVLQHNKDEVVQEILEKYAKNAPRVILYECSDLKIDSAHCKGREPEWYADLVGREVEKVWTHEIDGGLHSLSQWLPL